LTFRFLGTGTSVGVPQIGCSCPVCTSADPRDRRRRCGAYVRSGKVGFLIDTPPEMRLAAIEYGIDRVNAVVLTHAHMDHVAGFDDVRRFNTLNGTTVRCDPNEPGANGRTERVIGSAMRCFAMPETIEQMHRIFPYIGDKPNALGLFRPMIDFDPSDEFDIGGIHIERLCVEHGFPCCGYLLSDVQAPKAKAQGGLDISPSTLDCAKRSLAYISDCHEIPDETLAKMSGVDTLVLNCLRARQHPTHLSLEAALGYVAKIGPRRAFLIHMCHDFSHRQWLEKLAGTNVAPAFDGLELEV